jgi:hypothetical protein
LYLYVSIQGEGRRERGGERRGEREERKREEERMSFTEIFPRP